MGRRRRGDDAAGRRARGRRGAVPGATKAGGDEGAARQGEFYEEAPPKADAARHATHVGEFYENDEADARTRHARGYDPLDKHAQRVEAEVDDAEGARDDASRLATRVGTFLPRWRAVFFARQQRDGRRARSRARRRRLDAVD